MRRGFRIITFLLLAAGVPPALTAQDLDETFVPTVGLSEAWNGTMMAWDFDDDGDPDILLNGLDRNGNPRTWLLRYDGFVTEPVANGPDRQKATFTPRSINIPPFIRGTMDRMPPVPQGTERLVERSSPEAPVLFHARSGLMDLDGDGKAELLYMGGRLDPQLMRPQGSLWNSLPGSDRAFGPPVAFPGLVMARLLWKDLEGDGDADLVVSGHDKPASPFGQRLRIFENVDGTLVPVEDFRGGIGLGLVWTDFNEDGRHDLLLIGRQPDAWVRSLILL